MIPPLPWQISTPLYVPGRAFVIDAHGEDVLGGSVEQDLAEFLVRLANSSAASAGDG